MTKTATAIASTLLALCAALLVSFVQIDSAQACGSYGFETEEDRARFQLETHLWAEAQRKAKAQPVAAVALDMRRAVERRPSFTIDQMELFRGRLALARVTWTQGQQSKVQYVALMRADGMWRVIDTSILRA